MADERELRERMIEAVIGAEDASSRRLLEELEHHPELEREYHRLREAWESLGDLRPPGPPEGARERARERTRALFLAAVAREGETAPGGRPGRVAAGVLLFIAGGVLGLFAAGMLGVGDDSSARPASTPSDGRPSFALLIRGGDLPGNEAAATEAMTRWAVRLASEGRLAFATELDPEAAIRLGAGAAGAGGDLPVGGLFVVRAEDRAEAARLAGSSPHLAWGGAVDVVPVVPGG